MVSDVAALTGLYTNPAAKTTTGSNELGQQEFLQLLIAQLQNQDPMNPVENQEFVAELATFSDLEQSQLQTSLLEQILESQNSDSSSQSLALDLVGKEASVLVDQFTLQQGNEIDFTFLAPEEGIESVNIFNSSGELVRTDVMNITSAGEISYHFDGKNNNGDQLPEGEYRISVGDTVDEDGNLTSYPTFIRGLVEGVTFLDSEPILIVNGNATPFNEVYGVYEKTGTQ